jgi:hypothetical protein
VSGQDFSKGGGFSSKDGNISRMEIAGDLFFHISGERLKTSQLRPCRTRVYHFNGHFRNLNWRYPPFIRIIFWRIFQAYVKEYPHKTWPKLYATVF